MQVFGGAVALSGGGAEAAFGPDQRETGEHVHQRGESHAAAGEPESSQRHGGPAERVLAG